MRFSACYLSENPQGPGTVTRVGISPKFLQGGLGFLAQLAKGMRSQVSRSLIRALQGGNDSIDLGNIDLGRLVLMSIGSNQEKSASFEVPHVMPAHTGIIPIRHYERAIGSGDHVGRAKPFVATRPVENVHNLGIIARPALRDGIRPDDTGAGIAMDDLTLKNLGQKSAFVDHYACG